MGNATVFQHHLKEGGETGRKTEWGVEKSNGVKKTKKKLQDEVFQTTLKSWDRMKVEKMVCREI